jgi:hypothetical protein
MGFLAALVTGHPEAFGQGRDNAPTFSQEELDQMLAPIALYPDSLLAQVLVAATYPIEVVQADRWVKQNKNLKGERLNDALDKMNWDLSVKALVPFPQVLSMMSEKLEWTQKVGDAFLAQQADVMDTIQKLRTKAQAQGNLKTNKEQKVVVQDNAIVIEPANPTIVYVPIYDPAIVYGSWWYPAYPPYPYYPAGAVVAAGAFGFAAGVAVGAAWNDGWGRWNWGHHDIDVNINRNININRDTIANYQTASWKHDAVHRGGVPYHDAATRERYGQQGPGTAEGRQDFRGFSREEREGMQHFRGEEPATGTRPSAESTLQGLRQREGVMQRQAPEAFEGRGNGREARMNSDRGRMSREMSSGAFGHEGLGGGRGAGGFEGFGGRREEVADQVCAGNARAGLGEHRLPLPAIKVNHL